MDSAVQAAAPRPKLSERVPLRMIVFFGALVALVGAILYPAVDEMLTGGIKDAGGGYKLVNLQTMSTFPLDQVSGKLEDVPAKWRELDGKKVIFYGEMWQPFEAGGGTLGGFDLCYSIAKCCFSGPPQVQHFVKAKVVPGKQVYYHPNQVKVTGTLHVNVQQDAEAGKLASVYQMDVESVEPVR